MHIILPLNSRWLLMALLLAVPLFAQTPSRSAAARFLQQASWGPTADSIYWVQALGFERYLEDQFRLPASPISDVPPNANGQRLLRPMQQEFFATAIHGNDQLRQRVAFALSQIWVVSGNTINTAAGMVPYLRLLSQDAFENYYKIMYDVTLHPTMGRYLDMVNNDKPNPALGTSADENYARELLQLFTIGLTELYPDGSPRLDPSTGQAVPTYSQAVVEGFARAFTGWTYAPRPGQPSRAHNPVNYDDPMVAVEANHDTNAKLLLGGVTLPRGQTAARDLDDALRNVFNHPNVGPFIGRILIQHLVTSSPSSGYVFRVAQAFQNNGQGVRGDMKAVIRAILLDPEARQGDNAEPDPAAGHLREPVFFITSLIRALGGYAAPDNNLLTFSSNMGQNVFIPPSVFNYYSPGYRVAGLNAPEFQILSPATAQVRADFVNTLVYGTIAGAGIDLSPYVQAATNASALVDLVDTNLMAGRMPAAMRQSILRAVNAQTSANAKAQAAVYLTATSSQYQVQR